MNLTRLDSSLRKNLKDLLEGYLEHCEVSRHLTARIDFPIYHHGFKFGAPVFTHTGPSNGHEDRGIIGLLGLNDPHSQVASEVLLQFIEILSQEPRLADGSILRILPVANPIALELEADAPPIEELPVVQHLITRFHEEAADGILEIASHDADTYSLDGEATALLFAALEKVRSSVPAATGRVRILAPNSIALKPAGSDGKWKLRLTIPRAWTGAPEVHAISRFIARLIRTHIRLAATPRQHRSIS